MRAWRAVLSVAVSATLVGLAMASCTLPDEDYTSASSSVEPGGAYTGAGGASGASDGGVDGSSTSAGGTGVAPFPDGGGAHGGSSVGMFPDGGGATGGAGGGSPAMTCGNGKREGTEACDGTDLGGATCASVASPSATGSLYCNASCQFDTSACVYCGNGKKEGAEACDGTDLGGASCTSVVGGSGTLACDASCALVTSGCQWCGNGIKDGSEQCDGADLGGATCSALVGTAAGGTPTCSSCVLSTAGCAWCGDGACNNGESCLSCGDCNTTYSCTGVCCPDTVLAPTCATDPGDCFNQVSAACGGSVARVKFNGAYTFPTYCQVECESFTVFHQVSTLDWPNCTEASAVSYCKDHCDVVKNPMPACYTPGHMLYTACPQ
jgi:hypothetical protein